MTEYIKKVKCPDCNWSEFIDCAYAVAMTPCDRCNSTGYIYEPVEPDEGGLLPPMEIGDALDVARESVYPTSYGCVSTVNVDGLLEKQRDLTASILKAEHREELRAAVTQVREQCQEKQEG